MVSLSEVTIHFTIYPFYVFMLISYRSSLLVMHLQSDKLGWELSGPDLAVIGKTLYREHMGIMLVSIIFGRRSGYIDTKPYIDINPEYTVSACLHN